MGGIAAIHSPKALSPGPCPGALAGELLKTKSAQTRQSTTMPDVRVTTAFPLWLFIKHGHIAHRTFLRALSEHNAHLWAAYKWPICTLPVLVLQPDQFQMRSLLVNILQVHGDSSPQHF